MQKSRLISFTSFIFRDGNLIACAGKKNWFIVWSVPEERRLYNISLPENISVKQVKFLYSVESSVGDNNYVSSLYLVKMKYFYLFILYLVFPPLKINKCSMRDVSKLILQALESDKIQLDEHKSPYNATMELKQ